MLIDFIVNALPFLGPFYNLLIYLTSSNKSCVTTSTRLFIISLAKIQHLVVLNNQNPFIGYISNFFKKKFDKYFKAKATHMCAVLNLYILFMLGKWY